MKTLKVKGYKLEKEEKKRGRLASLFVGSFWFFFFVFVFLIGLSMILEGLFYATDIRETITDFAWTLGLAITGLFYFFMLAARYLNTWMRILSTVLVFILSYVLVEMLGPLVLVVFQYVTGAVIVLTGILVLINTARKIRDGVNPLKSFLVAAAYIVIGVCCIIWPDGLYFEAFMIGIYLCFLSGNFMWQYFTAGTRLDRIRRVKKIITIPTVFSSFLTIGFFKQVEAVAKENKLKEISDKSTGALDKKENQEKLKRERPDMVIFIHIRKGLLEGVGHVDFSFDGKVYCYGEYDEEAKYLGGVYRDGVLAVMDPREHVKRAVTDEKKLLIAYELKLTQRQKDRVRKKIEQIMSEAYPWQSKAELAANHLLPGKPMDYMDNASALYNLSSAKTYKFSKGSDYKTYYVFGQNCSRVANDMITQIGIRLRKLNGMITPGAYLNFMEELYKMPNSVISQRILFRGEEVDDQEIEEVITQTETA